jgi:hypothetical protein
MAIAVTGPVNGYNNPDLPGPGPSLPELISRVEAANQNLPQPNRGILSGRRPVKSRLCNIYLSGGAVAKSGGAVAKKAWLKDNHAEPPYDTWIAIGIQPQPLLFPPTKIMGMECSGEMVYGTKPADSVIQSQSAAAETFMKAVWDFSRDGRSAADIQKEMQASIRRDAFKVAGFLAGGIVTLADAMQESSGYSKEEFGRRVDALGRNEKCESCNGNGKPFIVVFPGEKCSRCNGIGRCKAIDNGKNWDTVSLP